MKIVFLILPFISFAMSFDNEIKLGKYLYEQTCISCHGKDGNGNKKVQFVVNPRKLSKTILNKEQQYYIIKDGAHSWGSQADIMPAFKYVYSKKEIKAISTYISKTFNPNIQTKVDNLYNKAKKIPENKKNKMLKRGKKIFNRNCSWCHGKTGEGNGLATTNPENSIFPYNLTKTILTKKQMFLYAKEGGKFWGTYKDDMASWKVKYDDYTIKSVIKYIDQVIRKNKRR